ncbi:MAG: BspA family leucine-rich repeat surface protein [Bacteroidetes bacterium]|nr:BspA family leucine-rich repeat surface protein [Bacteroidota bacterium]
MTKRVLFLFSILIFTIKLFSQEFITTWSVPPGGPPFFDNNISFYIESSGPVNYTWETIPAGTSGSGVFSGNGVGIGNLPSGLILLKMQPANLHGIKVSSLKLHKVNQWGAVIWNSMADAFNGCENLDVIASDIPDLSVVTDLNNMFKDCYDLYGPANMNNWDVSNINDFNHMFDGTINFNQNIGTWNTTNALYMRGMFSNSNFNQLIDGWNVSNVIQFDSMFQNNVSFNTSLANWNPLNATNMNSMFSMTAFNQNIGSWNTGNVIDMNHMFYSSHFNQYINLWDTHSAKYMNGMFHNTTFFNQPLDNWNTSNVIDMSEMFKNNSVFNEAVDNWNTQSVTNMYGMFDGATLFNQPLGNWNTSNVTNMYEMFHDANLFDQPIGNWNTSNVTTMEFMFAGAFSFNQPIGNWNLGNIYSTTGMFLWAVSFNQPIDNWNVSSLHWAHYMFDHATAFNQPLNNWNTSNLKGAGAMFLDAINFNQPLNNWNTSNVDQMGWMFQRATSFNQTLKDWNLSSLGSQYELARIFDSSGVDCYNYSSTITGWANNPATPSGRHLEAYTMHYDSISTLARDFLINTLGWSIIGDTISAGQCGPTSINNLISTTDVVKDFIPNPANNQSTITIICDQPVSASIYIYDFVGKVISHKEVKFVSGVNYYTLQVDKFISGVYLASIWLNKSHYTRKIIVSR